MKKTEKAALIDVLKDKFKRASAAFVAECQGIEAVEMNEARKAMRSVSTELRVVRNTLARKAVAGTEHEAIAKSFVGSTAIAFSFKDVAASAKVVSQFAKDQPKFKLKSGMLGARLIGLADIKGLAELPPRDVLLGRMLGSMKSPSTGIVMVMAGVPRKFLYALNAIKDAKSKAA